MSRARAIAMRLLGIGGPTRRAAERVTLAVGRVEIRLGLKAVLAVVADALLHELRGRAAVLVVREIGTGRLHVWRAGRLNGAAAGPVRLYRPQPHEAECYLAAAEAPAWSAVRGEEHAWNVIAFDVNGVPSTSVSPALAAAVAASVQASNHVVALPVARTGDWEGRLFLIDTKVSWNRSARLAAARHLVAQVDTALDNVYLLHRLRVRSAANERIRIARELHDGIIQSVMGVQIQLHALGARLSARSHPVASDLVRLATVLRDEALSLREMMQRMQPAELDPERLIDTIAAVVKRFQHETGISARFITNVDRVPLPPRACRELAHVVHEALVNIRKHSGASQVKVSLTLEGRVCVVSVDDNGEGFPFHGVLTQHDAAYERVGPRVIRDRVRLIGGDVRVVSAQRRGNVAGGAHLTISIPLASGYAIAG